MVARENRNVLGHTIVQASICIENPLGARALYIFQGNKDTLYRIHGTGEYWTIGSAVSSGCVRLINQDVIDLYSRVADGSQIVVL